MPAGFRIYKIPTFPFMDFEELNVKDLNLAIDEIKCPVATPICWRTSAAGKAVIADRPNEALSIAGPGAQCNWLGSSAGAVPRFRPGQ